MVIQRTANAGVLLTLDGITILLDGVCQEVPPYLPTPENLFASLLETAPDVVAFTHEHADHFSREFAQSYEKKTLRPVLGPESLPVDHVHSSMVKTGGVTIRPVQSRHIGVAGKTTDHRSYVISGSRCVWFMGDASPLSFRDATGFPRPDAILAPYAYVTTSVGWQVLEALQPQTLILLHMPLPQTDPAGLWNQVNRGIARKTVPKIFIPDMGERLDL